MNVGILGGTRFIGFHLVEALLEKGARVSIFHRGRTIEPCRFSGRVERFLGDRDRPSSLAPFFQQGYDAVIDLSGFNLRQVDPILSDWRCTIGHYLFCSTSSVYQTPPPLFFDEDAPTDREPGTYGGDKALAEEAILEQARRHNWPVTILRPQGVFGPFGAGQALYVFRRLLTGEPILVRPKTVGKRINFIWIDDLVECFIRAIGQPRAFGQVFNVAGTDICTPEDFCLLAEKVTGAGRLERIVLDARLAEQLPQLGLAWLDHDLVARNDNVKDRLGFTFTSNEEALKRTWAWALKEPGQLQRSPQTWERQARDGRFAPWWVELFWRARDRIREPVHAIVRRTARAARLYR
jgi:2'-hydroxyisoflavone reductase